MSKRFMQYVCMPIFIIAMIFNMSGCESTNSMLAKVVGNSSPGHQRAIKATASMTDAQDELMEAKSLIEETMTILEGIVQGENIDLRKQYNQFVKKKTASEKQCEKVTESAENMKTQGDAFFLAWEQELISIENPDIRRPSEERRTVSLKSHEKMTTAMQNAIDSFKSFLNNMKDIQKYLDIDLTPAGISLISTQTGKSKEKAVTAQETIDVAIAEIDRAVAEMPTN
jgi:hypothetical protein